MPSSGIGRLGEVVSCPSKQQTTIIIPQQCLLAHKNIQCPAPRAWFGRVSSGIGAFLVLFAPPYLSSRLIYSILRALSPIKASDRQQPTYHFLSVSAPRILQEALNCRASYERKDKPFPSHHSHDPRTAVCIFDSLVTQVSQLLAATRSSHTATLQDATVPDADITAASPHLERP
jgi:hypothetical protein